MDGKTQEVAYPMLGEMREITRKGVSDWRIHICETSLIPGLMKKIESQSVEDQGGDIGEKEDDIEIAALSREDSELGRPEDVEDLPQEFDQVEEGKEEEAKG
jgi:hypothetical protein